MNEAAKKLLKRVGITKDIPPTTPISALSGGERQAVARAMQFQSELIILDEPTNNLGVEETHGVLNFVRAARDSGHSCIFIAHNIYPKETTVEKVEEVITGMSLAALKYHHQLRKGEINLARSFCASRTNDLS